MSLREMGRVVITAGSEFALAKSMMREQIAIQRASRSLQPRVTWDFAEPRLLPILSAPSFDDAGEPLIRAASDLGVALDFAVEVERALVYVDALVAERWERAPDQLLSTAMAVSCSGAARSMTSRRIRSRRF